jgi:hypothetical protein
VRARVRGCSHKHGRIVQCLRYEHATDLLSRLYIFCVSVHVYLRARNKISQEIGAQSIWALQGRLDNDLMENRN